MSIPTIRDVAAALEAWAPRGTAQSYDNVGLQVGDASAPVGKALIALDLTMQVIEEAASLGASLIVTHHPLIFKPLRAVTAGAGPSGLIFALASRGIALYSAHTNLDAAPGGVSFALAEQLGLQDVRFLQPMAEALYKLATFVPESHVEAVREALARAGAGRIGGYEACAFTTAGTGYFRPGENASPFLGTRGGAMESVSEVRIEVEVPRWSLDSILKALRKAHPYEEVAYDVYPVQQPSTRAGLGAFGRLPEPLVLPEFLQVVADRLDARALSYAGDPEQRIERVAVCGGAGSDLAGLAMQSGADAYVTADVTYHRFFEVLDGAGQPRMAFIDAGHYQTESIAEALLLRHLAEHFPETEWACTRTRTSPIETYVRT